MKMRGKEKAAGPAQLPLKKESHRNHPRVPLPAPRFQEGEVAEQAWLLSIRSFFLRPF
jgi:hypothetical protein